MVKCHALFCIQLLNYETKRTQTNSLDRQT